MTPLRSSLQTRRVALSGTATANFKGCAMHCSIIKAVGLAGVAALALQAGLGRAAAVYVTTVSPTFGVQAASGDVVVGSHFGTLVAVGPGASAHDLGVSSAGFIKPAKILATVDGSAVASVIVPFRFGFTWDSAVRVVEPSLGFVSSGAHFGTSGFKPGIDATDVDADVDDFGLPTGAMTGPDSGFLFNPGNATSLSEAESLDSRVVTGFIIVAAGEVGAFSVITDASGRAFARVSEPASIGIAGLGLMAVLMQRRRRD